MTTTFCDHRDCPAVALRHIQLYGQDFHFCLHHWDELSPAVLAHLVGERADRVPEERMAGTPRA